MSSASRPRSRLRSKSRCARQRSLKFIKSAREGHDFPKGINGGKEGNLRGAMKEELFMEALSVLKDSKRIVDFLRKDGNGKDFWIWLGRGNRKGRRRQSIEVKSSQRGIDEYTEKVRRMAEKGEEVACADLLMKVKDDDDIFSLMDRIVLELNLS